MPGGGAPTAAETTMPFTVDWDQVRTQQEAPPRVPAPDAPEQPAGLPPGARRVGPRFTPRPESRRPPAGGPPGGGGPPPGRQRRPGPAPGQRRNLMKSSAGMAVGTLVSRGTGFVRTLVLAIALGVSGVGNAYNTANNLPNTVYYLMLGGVFTSVIVPLLVRAAKRDADHGEAYAQRVFTVGVLTLFGVTVVATALSAPIVSVYAGSFTGDQRHVTLIWAYWFMPQIFFYGMNSLIGAVLNTRNSFAAPMWTPTVNNLVVIFFGIVFILNGGTSATSISPGGVELIAFGTTAGIVLQTVALIPSLRRVGFRWRPVLGFRPGELGEMWNMASWMFVYVGTQFLSYTVVQIIANRAAPLPTQAYGYSAYSYAWQFFQLPYAIIGISVITALLPRMSEHAGVRRYSQVRNDFSTGVRLSSVIVVPAAIYLFVLGGPLLEILLAHGRVTAADAKYVGEVFGLFSLGLVPYMLTQLQLRVFYSFQDSRTAALVGLFTMTVGIAGDLIAYAVLPADHVVAGLAVAFGAANLIGAILGWILLLRRVGSLDGWAVARALTRMHLATVPGLIWAVVVMLGLSHVLDSPGRVYGLVVTVVGGGGAVLLYAYFARRLRVAEFGFLMRTIAGRFGGQSGRH
jgi:putative peptidoglycan lipid II flippase